ncbi:MAG TPA: hypothetical protein VHE99_12195, partial [Gammaproteobacteria bacterium]|nr:hypothetical protein [Gammaproteobacteria bacterium]
EDNYGLLSADIKAKLLKMSPATLDRLLKSSKIKYKRRGLCGTKPGYLIISSIAFSLGSGETLFSTGLLLRICHGML